MMQTWWGSRHVLLCTSLRFGRMMPRISGQQRPKVRSANVSSLSYRAAVNTHLTGTVPVVPVALLVIFHHPSQYPVPPRDSKVPVPSLRDGTSHRDHDRVTKDRVARSLQTPRFRLRRVVRFRVCMISTHGLGAWGFEFWVLGFGFWGWAPVFGRQRAATNGDVKGERHVRARTELEKGTSAR